MTKLGQTAVPFLRITGLTQEWCATITDKNRLIDSPTGEVYHSFSVSCNLARRPLRALIGFDQRSAGAQMWLLRRIWGLDFGIWSKKNMKACGKKLLHADVPVAAQNHTRCACARRLTQQFVCFHAFFCLLHSEKKFKESFAAEFSGHTFLLF